MTLQREHYRLGGPARAALAGGVLLVAASVVMEGLSSLLAPIGLRVGVTVVVLLAALALLLRAKLGETLVRIGSDGVHLRASRRPRFLPWREITSVRAPSKPVLRLEIELTSGEVIGAIAGNQLEAARVAERIQAGVAAYEDSELDTTAVRRGEASVSDWARRLRGLGGGAGASHRDGKFNPNRLWRIIESDTTGLDERAGAAVAIASSGDFDGDRLRAVARRTASPALETMLESLAERELESEELEQKLDTLVRVISPTR